MDIKLKINPEANNANGISYIDEPCIVESSGGRRMAIFITSEVVHRKGSGKTTILSVHLETGRIIEYDLDDDTLSFDDEKGIGEFTVRGERYRIRAFQDFDNYTESAVKPKEDEKD